MATAGTDTNMMWQFVGQLLLRARGLYWRLVYKGYRERYTIDPGFRFNGTGALLYGEGRIVLGEESYIGELSSIHAASGCEVRIGQKCAISHNVRIYTLTSVADADHMQKDIETRSGSVLIGDGVWIGANCFIGPGISIGDNAVIGANSVVTHSIPAWEIWGGVPARLIRAKRRASDI